MQQMVDPLVVELARVREKYKRSKKMLTVINDLVDGYVGGHELIYKKGVTRGAAYIYALRKFEGWVIVTTQWVPEERLANYILAAMPGDPHYEYMVNYWLARGNRQLRNDNNDGASAH